MSEFSTKLEAIIYTRPVSTPPTDWREFDQGPGIFHLPEGEETGIRLRNISDGELEEFIEDACQLKSLVMLNLSENRPITDEGLRELHRLEYLSILNLSSCGLTNIGMEHIAGLTHLTQLDLSYCNRINDLGMRKLSALTNLTFLNLQGCVKVTHAGAARLRRRGLTIKR
jgi:hypothetical protein